MEKTTSSNDDFNFGDDEFDIQACAVTDCTGLIPSLPLSEAEVESYNEVYTFLPSAAEKK